MFKEMIHVVKGPRDNLLSKHVCDLLGLLQCTVVSVDNSLFKGLRMVSTEYKIKLREC